MKKDERRELIVDDYEECLECVGAVPKAVEAVPPLEPRTPPSLRTLPQTPLLSSPRAMSPVKSVSSTPVSSG